jgi:hypothetical protein
MHSFSLENNFINSPIVGIVCIFVVVIFGLLIL